MIRHHNAAFALPRPARQQGAAAPVRPVAHAMATRTGGSSFSTG